MNHSHQHHQHHTTTPPISGDTGSPLHPAHGHMSEGHGHEAAVGSGGLVHSGMAMTFHFGYSEYVLFDGWHIKSPLGMVISCVALFILSVLYEGLKYKREDMLRKNAAAVSNQLNTIRVPGADGATQVATVAPPGGVGCDGGVCDGGDGDGVTEPVLSRPVTRLVTHHSSYASHSSQHILSVPHILQTFMHGVQVVLGYMLMLVFMTYNVWLSLAVVFGAMTGYFVFGSKKFVVVDVTEHCH